MTIKLNEISLDREKIIINSFIPVLPFSEKLGETLFFLPEPAILKTKQNNPPCTSKIQH